MFSQLGTPGNTATSKYLISKGVPAIAIVSGSNKFTNVADFPLTTTKKSGFLIGVTIVPNSKVDPDAPESRPLQRSAGIDTDDFAPLKATDAPELAKKFPDGVFILQIDLVAFYVPIVVKESTTFDAVLAQTNIRPEDIVYNDSSAITDASGKVITQHDVVYWLTDLHLSGQKYVP